VKYDYNSRSLGHRLWWWPCAPGIEAFSMKKTIAIIAALVVLVLGVGISCGIAAEPNFPFDTAQWDQTETPRKILVGGDSLTAQSSTLLQSEGSARAHTVDVFAVSGGAPCDLLSTYGTRFTGFVPKQVSFAFIGNARSDCMVQRLGGALPATLTAADVARVTAVYRQDYITMINFNYSHGAVTWFNAVPLMGNGTYHKQMTDSLNSMMSGLADQYAGVGYDTTARQLLSPTGVYSSYLAGQQVRYSDMTHLEAPYGTTLYALGLLAGPIKP
jgi:hypothetical protein